MKPKLHHVNFSTKNVAEMTEFYKRILLLESEKGDIPVLEKNKAYSGDVEFMTDGTTQTHIAQMDLDLNFKTGLAINPLIKGHIAFGTENLEEFKLSELEYSEKDTKIKVSRQTKVSQNISPEVTIEKNNKKTVTVSGTEIKSPIIGTAYLAPEPGAKKFVENGKKIKKGDTVMIVEAMKTMNHVPSPKDGVVKSVNVEDGQPVEYGQTLVVID